MKPSKIVAGSEPQRTNELLVALAKLLETKKNSTSTKTTNKATANNQSQINGNSSSPSKVPKTSTKTQDKDGAATTKKTTTETPRPSVPVTGVQKSDTKTKANANPKTKEVPAKAPASTKPSILKSGPKTTEESIKLYNDVLKSNKLTETNLVLSKLLLKNPAQRTVHEFQPNSPLRKMKVFLLVQLSKQKNQ